MSSLFFPSCTVEALDERRLSPLAPHTTDGVSAPDGTDRVSAPQGTAKMSAPQGKNEVRVNSP
jgi:hypothetical protein